MFDKTIYYSSIQVGDEDNNQNNPQKHRPDRYIFVLFHLCPKTIFKVYLCNINLNLTILKYNLCNIN